MSNGESVADCWEEIDDVNLTNQLDKIKQEAQQIERQNKPASDQAMALNGNIPAMMMAMNPDDGNYVASKPTVKILRRPTPSSDSRNNDKPKQPIKTLQQREQEYAEARLRILGSAKNPEDELEAALEKLLSTNTTNTAPPQIQPPIKKQNLQPSLTHNSFNNINSKKVQDPIIAQQQLLLSSLTISSPEYSYQQRQVASQYYNYPPPLPNESYVVPHTSFTNNYIYYPTGITIGATTVNNTLGGVASGSTLSDFSESDISEQGVTNYNPNQMQIQPAVLRLPRGPDNSGGFKLKR